MSDPSCWYELEAVELHGPISTIAYAPQTRIFSLTATASMIPWSLLAGQLGGPGSTARSDRPRSRAGDMGEQRPDAMLAMERDSTSRRASSLQRQIEELAEQQSLTTHDDEHDPEGVTIAYQRAQLQGLLAGARTELEAIDRALERLRAGTYGICTRCGGEITRQRLVALPATSTCIDCARHSTQTRTPRPRR